jgi:hypothetical protein
VGITSPGGGVRSGSFERISEGSLILVPFCGCTLVKRLEFLVDAGAEPPVKLALARSSLHELEAQNLEALSSFTS